MLLLLLLIGVLIVNVVRFWLFLRRLLRWLLLLLLRFLLFLKVSLRPIASVSPPRCTLSPRALGLRLWLSLWHVHVLRFLLVRHF